MENYCVSRAAGTELSNAITMNVRFQKIKTKLLQMEMLDV
jgi:hypothetical protein